MWQLIHKRLSTVVGAATFSGLLLHATAGSPQMLSSALDLRYDAPDQCPSRHVIEQAALQLAGQMPRSPVVAHVLIEKETDGFRAHVKTHTGQRVLRDVSCAAVAEAIEVILALAIDPNAHVAHDGTSPGSAQAVVGSGTPALDSLGAVISPPVPQERTHVDAWQYPPNRREPDAPEPSSPPSAFVSATLGIETGALPKLAEVVTVRFSIATSARVRIAPSARYWRPSSETLPGTVAGGDFSLWALAGAACFVAGPSTPALSLCAGLEAGRLSGASFGVRSNGSGASLWLAPMSSLEAQFPTTQWLAIVLGVEAAVPLVRRGFYLQEVGTAQSARLHEPSLFSGRLYLGLSLSL